MGNGDYQPLGQRRPDDLLDLGLEEEESLLDLQLVALEVDQLVYLHHSLLHLQTVLVVVRLVYLALQLGSDLLDVGEHFCLQVLQLLLQFRRAVLLYYVSQFAHSLQLLLKFALAEGETVFDGV